jgi:uncharacterized protein YjbI with pentapeptide repeats
LSTIGVRVHECTLDSSHWRPAARTERAHHKEEILVPKSLVSYQELLTRVLTEGEKTGLLIGHTFGGATLDHVDLARADLRASRFEDSCLRGSDFSNADLRGAWFLRCDLRGTRFRGARLADNWFVESWFVGAVGFSAEQRKYVEERGGCFLRLLDREGSLATSSMPASVRARRRP